MTERRLRIVIDPSGAETGGRVVKRTLDEMSKSAIDTKSHVQRLSQAYDLAAKSAQASAQSLFQQQDALRAKFNPTYAVMQRFKQVQEEIRQAHRLGALSTIEMSNALSRERQAALSSIAALKGHTSAVVADNAALRLASFQRRNLIFQLNDIAVSLASGMNPLMVFAQQGSQITQIYAGQGGVTMALRQTAAMAGSAGAALGTLGPIAIAAGVAAVAGLAHIRSEASAALGDTVTWGETLTAVFQVAWEGLKSTFGPAFSAVLDPVFYAFEKLGSASVDIAEVIINSFRAVDHDIKFMWDQLPNIVGAAFVGAVNIAIKYLNQLASASKQAVNEIIEAFNKIPGVDLPKADASRKLISPLDNPYADALAKANEPAIAEVMAILNSHPLREFADASAERIGSNRALSGLSGLADIDFSRSIQGATSLGSAVNGIGTAAQQAQSTIIDVNQQMMDSRRQTLTAFEQSGNQLRTMKTELSGIQKTLAAAAKTPISDVFGSRVSGQAAADAISSAVNSVQRVFAAMDSGSITAKTAHESLELVRQSLLQIGGDTKSVNAFFDALVNGSLRVRQLESDVKSLNNSIQSMPDKVINIGIRQYTVGTAGGGTKAVNVYGGAANYNYQSYDVGGGKSVGVTSFGGNAQSGSVATQTQYDIGGKTVTVHGTRAAGGPVEAGKRYLVGENGPELLTMGGAGMVANTNSTAAILSGGRDTLSLIEDHLYSALNELKVHTGYLATAESDTQTMIASLQAIKSTIGSVGTSYARGGGSSYTSGGSRGSFGGYGSGTANQNEIDFISAYNFMGIGSYNGTGAIGYDTYSINPSVHGPATGIKNLHSGFATGGQIMPGEDQRVEFFKKNSERVIIVDDSKVSDGRGGGKTADKPSIHAPMNFHFNGNLGDQKSRQAMADEIRRTVLSVMQGK